MGTIDRTSIEPKTMIQLSGVDKIYRLGEINNGTLHRDLQSWWARKRGLPDPNKKLGQDVSSRGEFFYALQNIDLSVYRGERLGIIGGNGAGKSTLLKLISRVTSPSAGRIDLYGRVTSMLEVGTGFHPEMTGRENIYLNGAILGMSKREIDAVLDDIIDFSEVRQFIDTPVKRYSSGMYVKLAFSVAAHLQSEIVIMDEVLAVGDLAFQGKCIQKMIQAAQEEERTILYVSHNMKTVRDLCNRCIVLDRGKIIYNGDVEKAVSYYSEYLLKERGASQSYSTLSRTKDFLTGLVTIETVTLPENSIKEGEALHFSIKYKVQNKNIPVLIRLIVVTPSGDIVGMASSETIVLHEKAEEISYIFDTNSLAPGVYCCDIAVCMYENNVESRHDFISKAFSFSIEERVLYFGRSWSRKAWGNVKLNEVKIEKQG